MVKKMKVPIITSLFLWTLFAPLLHAEPHFQFNVVGKGSSEGMDYQVEQIASGFGIPWGLTFIEQAQLLVSIRSGQLYLIDLDKGTVQAMEHPAKIHAVGQGGLLDVELGPDRQWAYFTYSALDAKDPVTVLARAKRQGLRWVQWKELLVTRSGSDNSRHFGSRIAFDNEGYLYFSIGDRGHRPNGQDLMTHAGAILRLTQEGNVPMDNPFKDKDDALPEIWSFGHRNPQGLFYDTKAHRLWSIEHGPRGGDEINLIKRGGNYGWAVVSHGKEYWNPMMAVGDAISKPGMIDPVKVYTPSIAPSSLIVYRGAAFPKWQGSLFAGALKLTHLNRVVIGPKGKPVAEERLLESMGERVRDLVVGPKGWLYFSADSGSLYRLKRP